jgi:hypothetical protein
MILARIKLWSAAIGLVIAALVASWLGGRKSAESDIKTKELESYANTRKDMDQIGRMSDADAAREWLRDRSKH